MVSDFVQPRHPYFGWLGACDEPHSLVPDTKATEVDWRVVDIFSDSGAAVRCAWIVMLATHFGLFLCRERSVVWWARGQFGCKLWGFFLGVLLCQSIVQPSKSLVIFVKHIYNMLYLHPGVQPEGREEGVRVGGRCTDFSNNLLSGFCFQTELMIRVTTGSHVGGILSRIFFLTTAMMIEAASSPFQGTLTANISWTEKREIMNPKRNTFRTNFTHKSTPTTNELGLTITT